MVFDLLVLIRLLYILIVWILNSRREELGICDSVSIFENGKGAWEYADYHID
jgi:hypothetical protein